MKEFDKILQDIDTSFSSNGLTSTIRFDTVKAKCAVNKDWCQEREKRKQLERENRILKKKIADLELRLSRCELSSLIDQPPRRKLTYDQYHITPDYSHACEGYIDNIDDAEEGDLFFIRKGNQFKYYVRVSESDRGYTFARLRSDDVVKKSSQYFEEYFEWKVENLSSEYNKPGRLEDAKRGEIFVTLDNDYFMFIERKGLMGNFRKLVPGMEETKTIDTWVANGLTIVC
jgi:hypothetical protein